jgi:hypothetical protein
MKLTIEFPEHDTVGVAEVLEKIIPADQVNSVLEQLEDPNNYTFPRHELTHTEALDLLDRIATIVGRMDNHYAGCQGLALRRVDLCDCDLGRLHRLLKDSNG